MRKQINNISKHTIADLYRDTTEAERVELIDGQYYHMPMVILCINNLCLKSVARYAATSMIEDYRIRYIMDALACSLMITIW